jgi:tetratricopeptide (TPR) repeat protein
LDKTSEAVELTKRALKINPLDRTLRVSVALLTLQQGRDKAAAGDFDEARVAFREAIDLDPLISATIGRAAWAACEYKEGNSAKAAELMAELNAKPEQRIASAYYLAVECNRVKVARPILKEMQARFNDALASPVSNRELGALVTALSFYRSETPVYRGIGTHEKKIHALLQAAVDAQPSEEELCWLGFTLRDNRIHKILKSCAEQGVQRYPDNPCFKFLLAEQAILQKPKTFRSYDVGRLFRWVMNKIEDKSDELSRKMRDAIEARVEEYPQLETWVRTNGFPESW